MLFLHCKSELFMSVDIHDKILGLLTSFLGDYGKESGEWYSFDCPYCAEEKMVEGDGKYNLEVTIDPDTRGCGGFHCWRCGEYSGMKGSLTRLFKRYAGERLLSEYRDAVLEYRESKKYELPFAETSDEFAGEFELSLPEGFKFLNADDPAASEAYAYVLGRGLDDRIIKRYHIGYVGRGGKDRSASGRIYFPSYDMYDTLTYWTGRDYTGADRAKSKNPKVSKNEIIFNESLINWYEPITLVEGPFDHVVTPNSIPLLGKTMEFGGVLYNALVERSRSLVNIFLDDDAVNESYKLYRMLSSTRLYGRVRIVDGTNGHDASDIYREFGYRGILSALCGARSLSDYELWRK